MQQGFFQKIIAAQLAAGSITSMQAETLGQVLLAMAPQQRAQLQEMLTKEPQLIPLMIDNIGQKIQAVNADSMAQWKKVVDEQLKKLSEIE